MFSKTVLVFTAFFTIVFSSALQAPGVKVLSQNADIQPDGTFAWNYELEDGTKQAQSGTVKLVNDEPAEVLKGGVSFTDPDGGKHELSYVADENGYQPQGADVPVPPEIPSAIVKALDYIASHQPAPAPLRH